MGTDELAERGTPEFYREQVVRLVALAALAATPEGRLELLDIASVFQKLADHAPTNRDRHEAIDVKSIGR